MLRIRLFCQTKKALYRGQRLWLPALLVPWLLWGPAVAGACPQSASEVDQLAISLRVRPSLVEWYNQVARPDDMALVAGDDNGGLEIALLDEIKAGRKGVIIESLAKTQDLAPDLAGQVDLIRYDLAFWPATASEETGDPETVVRQMAELAHTHDVGLVVGLDRHQAQDSGADVAPRADVVILVLHRLQGDPTTLIELAQPLIQDLRSANPHLDVYVELRVERDLDRLLTIVDALSSDIDGVSIDYGPAAADLVKEFVARLRPGDPRTALTPAPTEEALPDLSVEELAAETPQPLPEPTLPSTRCTWPVGIVFTGSSLTAALVGRRHRKVR